MNRFALPIALLAFPFALAAQNSVPSGTLLPLRLDTGLDAAKLHAGQNIRATLMQPIPGTSISRHAKVLGRVVSVNTGNNARLELRFDAIEDHGQRTAIQTSLRAMASFIEVQEAKIPEDMSSRGLTPENWTTQQIGGDQVYRGGGPVTEGLLDVGKPEAWGVVAVPRAQSGTPCRAGDRPQALGVFSADACGLYGLPGVQIDQAGRESGDIVLSGPAEKLNVRAGAALLLHVE